MPELKPTLIEKLTIIRHREGFRTSDDFAEKIGLTGPTLRAYEGETRNPSKFARMHIERLVEAYERGGLKEMLKVGKEARE